MAGGILTGLGIFYVAQSLRYDQDLAGLALIPVVGLIAIGTVVSVVPAARLSDRIGRKKVIWGSCVLGVVGLGLVALAPSVGDVPVAILTPTEGDGVAIAAMLSDARYYVALVGAVIYGLSTGAFLAVDWALITDIIPKASSGRYMGISNVATASAGILALAFGGLVLDRVAAANGDAAGPVAAMWLAVVLVVVGAVLLVPVKEGPRTETESRGDSAGDSAGESSALDDLLPDAPVEARALVTHKRWRQGVDSRGLGSR